VTSRDDTPAPARRARPEHEPAPAQRPEQGHEPVAADGGGRSPRRGPRRAVRRGTERETVWGATTDDEGEHDSNDERLRRDVPPHW
jgi:hypothetical protein